MEKSRHLINVFLRLFIAGVWLMNGLFAKILNRVPRHQQIVARILKVANPRPLTLFIGLLEVLMAIWILSKLYPKSNLVIQIMLIATMNILEFFLARDLLLWGAWNLLWATGFIFLLIISNRLHLTESK